MLTVNPKECATILSENGFGIGYDKICEGLRQGIFSFGVAFKMPSEQWAYIIYRKDLQNYIEAHGGTMEAPMQ